VLLGGSPVGPVSASIGYASYPEETTSADQLMDLADKRMYAIKEGRSKGKMRRIPVQSSASLRLDSTGTCQD
jgi:GGDEF domain-containing protein